MILLSAEGINKHYGPEPVLDRVSFELRPGERIGLVGPNGTGKTTLLKILAGIEDPDGGTLEIHSTVRIGYLEQHPMIKPGHTLWDEARDALDSMFQLQQEAINVSHLLADSTAGAEHDRLAARYDHLQQELHRHDAYNLDHKIERVLDGLGFTSEMFKLSIEALSGGEQNRLMLAKLLLAEPDVMLLDEPSNHLDIEATEWLEDFLAASRTAMILVSHDRYFLDKVTNRTLELFHGTVDGYQGNFSAYWRQKAERLMVERRAYEKQQIEIAKTEDFIRRNRYGQKHAQAEDRKKKLQRIEPVDPPREIAAPPMGFPEASRSGDVAVRVEHLAKGYDRPLFDDVSFDILRGQRWGILGPNGSGKTTLLKCLLGEVAPDAGRIVIGQGVEIGYFDQHLSSLEEDEQVVDAVRPDRVDFDEQKRRDLLARFGILGDTALQPVGSLSGGERCRAALARLSASEKNFLILDEPTNHLDLWARDALERSLRHFDGTVLFISHDRYFVDQVADHLLVVEPGRFRVIEGNYATYQHLVRQGMAREAVRETANEKPKAAARSRVQEDAPKTRKRRFPYRKVADLEKEVFEREQRVEELHAALATPEVLRDGDQVRELTAQVAEEQAALERLYEHWEEATDLNW